MIGLLADPGLAAEVAEQLAAQLSERLAERVSDRVWWSVLVVVEDLVVGEQRGDRMLDRAARRRYQQGWDYAVCLTDLPLPSRGATLVAELSATQQVAVVSLPAFGARRPTEAAREVILRLLDELTEPQRGTLRPVERCTRGLEPPVRPVTPDEPDVDLRLVSRASWLRLITGMIRVNRPWRLVLGLSTALPGALATAAFGIVSPAVWQLAEGLGPLRLCLASVCSLAAFVAWLIYRRLWQPLPGPGPRRRPVALANTATVLSVALGALFCYAVLYLLTFLASSLVDSPTVVRLYVPHPIEVSDYLRLAWLVSSMATVGGALGAGLEHAAVRTTTYGSRHRAADHPEDTSRDDR